ncbi:MAG TPA: ABC transporter substrate-binding protein [Caulobacteraceae bacterium]|jgi:NitT/TauT family transport system substrate-binding protein
MRFAGLVFVALLALGACSQQPAASGGRTTIRFATDWKAEAEHGGFYEALATGEYAKRGLDVRIIQGGPSVNVEGLLAAGAVEMGDGSNSFILAKLVHQNAPIVAVAAFMQKDPQILMAHPDAGISSLADMKGHPIMISEESRTAFWPFLKAKYGFTDDQVHSYNDNSQQFILDKSIVQEGYLTSEPYTVQKAAGWAPKVFLLADQGYPSYAAMVLAPTSLIAKNPAAVKAFVEASAAGWRNYVYGDAKPADALILKANPDMTEDVLAQARDKMRQFGLVGGGDAPALGIGAMTDQHWADFFRVAAPADLANYKRAFTLQFLPNPPVKP